MIAFDNKGEHGFAGAGIFTFNFTTSGNHRVLYAQVVSTGTIISFTYGGMGFSIISNTGGGTTPNRIVAYLVNPPIGLNSFDMQINGMGNTDVILLSYTGTRQTAVPDNFDLAGPTLTNTFSESLTTVSDNCWLLMFGTNTDTGLDILSAGANTTIRFGPDGSPGTGLNFGSFATDSNALQTPPGSFSQSVTSTAPQTFNGTIVSFAPFLSQGRGSFLLAYLSQG